MKLSIAISTVVVVLSMTAANAGQIGSGGVKSIKDNGRINGDPSYTITCGSGYGVVRRSGNAWANNTGSTYSSSLWSLSLSDFARKMCS
jgi:hypothetical protein